MADETNSNYSSSFEEDSDPSEDIRTLRATVASTPNLSTWWIPTNRKAQKEYGDHESRIRNIERRTETRIPVPTNKNSPLQIVEKLQKTLAQIIPKPEINTTPKYLKYVRRAPQQTNMPFTSVSCANVDIYKQADMAATYKLSSKSSATIEVEQTPKFTRSRTTKTSAGLITTIYAPLKGSSTPGVKSSMYFSRAAKK